MIGQRPQFKIKRAVETAVGRQEWTQVLLLCRRGDTHSVGLSRGPSQRRRDARIPGNANADRCIPRACRQKNGDIARLTRCRHPEESRANGPPTSEELSGCNLIL